MHEEQIQELDFLDYHLMVRRSGLIHIISRVEDSSGIISWVFSCQNG
jgi:hypothetical protein